MSDVVIVGGGVIGLTCAYELARDNRRVTVIDQGAVGRAASWAGAGMIPPGGRASEPAPLQRLADQAASRWPVLSQELLGLSSIDNEYLPCGSFHFSVPGQSPAEWETEVADWSRVTHDRMGPDAFPSAMPHVGSSYTEALYFPTAAQVRNPRHLQALRAACDHYGVTFVEHAEVTNFNARGGQITSVTTKQGVVEGQQFLVTAGAWTSRLLEPLTSTVAVEPVRGQIVLLKLPRPLFTQLLECGPRYLVPRRDGHVLIGSTEEWAGFEANNTEEGIDGLKEFAYGLVPELRDAEVVQTWAGLRPFSRRRLPYVGQIPDWGNLFVAAGHFRAGLSLSPATALLVKELLQGKSISAEMASLYC